jgi:peptide/nickel transport system substrate-binding protein
MKRLLACVITLAFCVAAGASQAKTLHWSSQGDYLTADPHAFAESLTFPMNGHVYEGLVIRDRKLNIIPGLATSWSRTSPTVWIFNLRKGVKWHDGSPFTADDVVFSVKRIQGPTSGYRSFTSSLGEVRKIDDYTVEFTTKGPNPTMLDSVWYVLVMNKAWCEKNHVEKSQNFAAKEESYASRNAMGTGPFVLVSREADVKSVFRKNPEWWGLKEPGYFDGNVDEIIYTPVKSDSTRVAGLLSGDLDFILDPPVQDIEKLRRTGGVRLFEGRENRIMLFGMDQARDELLYSNVKGRNPFKDKRVRQAFYQAIDAEAIKRTVMRGLSVPTAIAMHTGVGLPAELDQRYPVDLVVAKRLLAEAGYPNGFEVTLDCPNNRYINDEKICVAVAGMLSKIGVTVKVNAMPRSQFFPKMQKLDTSFYFFGWGPTPTDAIFTMQPVFHSCNERGDGDYNYGNYKDDAFDALIDQIAVEMDVDKRRQLVVEALKMHHDKIFHIPLHWQVIPWAARSNVEVTHLPTNALRVPWVTIR